MHGTLMLQVCPPSEAIACPSGSRIVSLYIVLWNVEHCWVFWYVGSFRIKRPHTLWGTPCARSMSSVHKGGELQSQPVPQASMPFEGKQGTECWPSSPTSTTVEQHPFPQLVSGQPHIAIPCMGVKKESIQAYLSGPSLFCTASAG